MSEEITMDEAYGDGSSHKVCTICGLCIDCGDCKLIGCEEEEQDVSKKGDVSIE